MSSANVHAGVSAVSPEQVKATLEKVVAVAQMLVKLTPTTIDDGVVTALAALSTQDWFIQAVVFVMGKFSKGETVSPEEIKVHFAH